MKRTRLLPLEGYRVLIYRSEKQLNNMFIAYLILEKFVVNGKRQNKTSFQILIYLYSWKCVYIIEKVPKIKFSQKPPKFDY